MIRIVEWVVLLGSLAAFAYFVWLDRKWAVELRTERERAEQRFDIVDAVTSMAQAVGENSECILRLRDLQAELHSEIAHLASHVCNHAPDVDVRTQNRGRN